MIAKLQNQIISEVIAESTIFVPLKPKGIESK
jgi:hypothetical protein